MNRVKKFLTYIITTLIYWWGCLWYDKKYLTGRFFDRYSLSKGWFWIIKYWFPQKILGYNRHVPFPVPRYAMIANVQNIIFNPDDMEIFQTVGTYFQGIGAQIRLGTPVFIAPGVGLITANHDLNNLSKSAEGKEIIIGSNCWIGMNAIILPGVELGDHTIVGAGAVVTKSFIQGKCVIAGNPAKVIRYL